MGVAWVLWCTIIWGWWIRPLVSQNIKSSPAAVSTYVSIVHGLMVLMLTIPELLGGDPSRFWFNSRYGISIGYYLYDMVIANFQTSQSIDWKYVGHHLMSILILFSSCKYANSSDIRWLSDLIFVLAEITNPCQNWVAIQRTESKPVHPRCYRFFLYVMGGVRFVAIPICLCNFLWKISDNLLYFWINALCGSTIILGSFPWIRNELRHL